MLKSVMIVLILSSALVFAAGSGAGGGLSSDCQDVWSCSVWTPCTKSDIKTRSCSLVGDCASDVSRPPDEVQSCDYGREQVQLLACKDGDLDERVECRLLLEPGDYRSQLAVGYLPSLCRDVQDVFACVQRHSLFRPCWDHSRPGACIKAVLNISDVPQAIAQCGDAVCRADIEGKVIESIMMRFEALAHRAESAYRSNLVSRRDAMKFMVVVENAISGLERAQGVEEQRAVVLEVRFHWNRFLEELR